jgi:hypothetical protein
MSQTTEDLTRSELRAIRGHYQRRVWLAFLIPALIAAALGWLLFQDQDANSGEPSQATPRTTVSGPITKEVVSKNCVAAPGRVAARAPPVEPSTGKYTRRSGCVPIWRGRGYPSRQPRASSC